MLYTNNNNKRKTNFIEGDYLLVFLALMLIILVVLIISLIKSRQEYNDLLDYTNKKEIIKEPESLINEVKSLDEDSLTDDLLKEFDALKTSTTVEEEKPIIKQVNLSEVKTYNDIIDEYENSEEENAVISAEELERRTKERIDELGSNDNQVAIAKYEEEQEKKAIISYEQLLKNASNITLSYKEEEKKDKEAPRINKIEVEQKEVIGTENYLEEEEFLKILKEFRMTL